MYSTGSYLPLTTWPATSNHSATAFEGVHSLTQPLPDLWTPCQLCPLSAIAELCSNVLYQFSPLNAVVDCLSRVPVSAVILGVDNNQMAALQSSSLDI